MTADELNKLADRYEDEARQYEREDSQHDPSRREIAEWRATAAALRLAATMEEFGELGGYWAKGFSQGWYAAVGESAPQEFRKVWMNTQ